MKDLSLDNLLREKQSAKGFLSEILGVNLEKKPLLGLFIDQELNSEDEEKMENLLEAIDAVDINVVILADSNLNAMKSARVLNYDRKNRKKLLEAADMAVTFSFSDIEEMLIHGVIPITPSREGILDYNPRHETGNSFVYHKDNFYGCFAALVRAMETFKLPYDWKHIIKEGVSSVVKKR